MTVKTAGVIIIGDEILSGSVKDENIHFLCQRFHELGIKVDKVVTVNDNVKHIAEEVFDFSNKFDVVVTTGGVGPTHDDMTYEGVAEAFGLNLELNEQLFAYWRGCPEENESSAAKMSKIPNSSKIIFASLPGREKTPVVVVSNVFIFPGTPTELKQKFKALEQENFNSHGIKFYKRELFLRVDETDIVSALNLTVNCFPDVSIGSYPELNNPNYLTRITFQCHEEIKVNEAYNMLLSNIDASWIIYPESLRYKL